MSSLALVRHGQASFFSDNYDQLSPLGEQQARLLGQYWLRRGVRVDEVYTGPRVRQIETAALAGEAFAAAGFSWPEPKILPELDEHQVDRLIKVGMQEIGREHAHIGPLHAAYLAAECPRDRHRTFQLMFERIVMLWVQEKIGADGVESWPEFQRARSARVWPESPQASAAAVAWRPSRPSARSRSACKSPAAAATGPPSTWAGASAIVRSPISSSAATGSHSTVSTPCPTWKIQPMDVSLESGRGHQRAFRASRLP